MNTNFRWRDTMHTIKILKTKSQPLNGHFPFQRQMKRTLFLKKKKKEEEEEEVLNKNIPLYLHNWPYSIEVFMYIALTLDYLEIMWNQRIPHKQLINLRTLNLESNNQK